MEYPGIRQHVLQLGFDVIAQACSGRKLMVLLPPPGFYYDDLAPDLF